MPLTGHGHHVLISTAVTDSMLLTWQKAAGGPRDPSQRMAKAVQEAGQALQIPLLGPNFRVALQKSSELWRGTGVTTQM